jgi:cold shock CspA family protein
MDVKLKDNKGQLKKWLDGFGFIRFEHRDVFVHRTAYLQGFKPEVGQILLFDFGLAPDPTKPPVAINVRVVKNAEHVAAEESIRSGLEALLSTKIDTIADTTVVRTVSMDGAA